MRNSLSIIESRVLGWAFFSLVAFGVFAVGNLAAERVLGRPGFVCILAGLIALSALVVVVMFAQGTLVRLLNRLVAPLVALRWGLWLIACIVVGWVLRIAWVFLVPPVQKSDMGIYLGLARSLAERGIYEYEGFRVWFPPGLPLFLYPSVKLFGSAAWLPWFNNLLLFAGTVCAVYVLGRRLAGNGAARLASLFIVFWPNHIMLVGLVSKELLLLFLLTLATFLITIAGDGRGRVRWGWYLAGGLVIGACILTQPAIIALLPAFLVFIWWNERRIVTTFFVSALFIASATLIVSPWTIRNYLLFKTFIPVSANGGQLLFVGNNPEATGGYIPIEKRYTHLDEVAYDRLARHLALTWIGENPGRFLALMPRKQILFLGDSADGPYWSMKENLGITDFRYAAAKGLANAYWLGILVLMGAAIWRHRRGLCLKDPRIALQMLFFLCFFAVFSVTESGGRQHICLSGFCAILASLAIISQGSENNGSNDL